MDYTNVKIRKRSGTLVDFDGSKIHSAIAKAIRSTSEDNMLEHNDSAIGILADTVYRSVLSKLEEAVAPDDGVDDSLVDVVFEIEHIQDVVEEVLANVVDFRTAKAYITYRYQHAKNRDTAALLLDVDKTMGGYLKQDDWRVNENSNVNYSIGGLILHNSGAIVANYWLKNIYSEEIAKAHKTAAMHLHDLSMFGAYCFTGDTRIQLVGGLTASFEELVSAGIKECLVYAYDSKTGKMVEALAKNPRITKQTNRVAIVTLDKGTCIVCTVDHLFMNVNKEYVEAQNLVSGNELATYYECLGDTTAKAFVKEVTVLDLETPIDMYDLTVDGYENFSLHAGGVVVHNCAGWSIRQLLIEGLGGVPDKITSEPAHHLSTAIQQIVNFLGIMQNEWAGAQAFSSFDTYLAPFIRVDNMSEKEIKQCMQTFLYGVNTPSRWGTQAPFSNVTFDWVVPSDLAEKPAIVAGKEQDFTYGDCQKEMDLFNKCYLEVMVKGDATGRGFQYPIPTYNITKDFVWDTPNAQLLFEMTAKYGTPYFQNFINSDLNPNDVRSMCPLTEDTQIVVFDTELNKMGRATVKDLHMLCSSLPGRITKRYLCYTAEGWKPFMVSIQQKQKVYRVDFGMGISVNMGEFHEQPVYTNDDPTDMIIKQAKDLAVGDNLPFVFFSNIIPDEFGKDEFVPHAIKSIDEITDYNGELYCLSISTDSHLFALANGLITHNCRLQLDKRELRKRGGGLFGSDEFTGSIGVVTVNLPQIGYLAQDEDDFYRRLDHVMDLAKDSLVTKRKVVTQLNNNGLFPYTARYLKNFKNHFATIGLCGMNECCLNFLGCDIVDEKGHKFAEEVLIHMRDRLSQYQVETGDLFNLEATPAESTSYRLAKHDRDQFPGIISSGDADPYYTNSSQLPVGYTSDLFDALDRQEPLQTKYTGGTVFHVFLGESITDYKACRDLVKSIAYNYRIPYFSISPTFSICPIHGFIAGQEFECPTCKAERTETLKHKISVLEEEKTQIERRS